VVDGVTIPKNVSAQKISAIPGGETTMGSNGNTVIIVNQSTGDTTSPLGAGNPNKSRRAAWEQIK
jgi:hypothetical protein